MTIAEAKSKIDLLQYVVESLGVKPQRAGNTYRINPCPKCGAKDHFAIYPETNSYHSFNGCCQGGSIVDFLMEIENLSKPEALKKVEELAGTAEPAPLLQKKKDLPAANEEVQVIHDFTQLIMDIHQNRTNYYSNRGLTKKTIDRYMLGYHEQGLNYAIEKAGLKEKTGSFMGAYRFFLPVLDADGRCRYFITRLDESVIPEGAEKLQKTHNLKGLRMRLFNDRYIHKPSLAGKYIFVTEGIFDALSIEEFDHHAVALNSTQNAKGFLELVEQSANELREKVFIIVADNDEAGSKMKGVLTDGLRALNLAVMAYNVPNQYKDANDFLQADRATFEASVRAFIDSTREEGMVISYMRRDFFSQIERNRANPILKTGFDQLDKKMGGGLYPGLYALGAISSLGKTTFALQIADYIAANGHDVLFFSLEMSKFEIVSKSLSREAFRIKPGNAPGTRDVMNGRFDENLMQEAWGQYEPTAKRLAITEGNFNTNVLGIREQVEKHIAYRGKPVVFVDYLQVLSPVSDRMNDKQATDRNVVELKRISRDYDIPVIAISSLNRQSYITPVSFESFKESGAIEFTADTVIGLQLAGISEIDGTDPEKRSRLNELKAQTPRGVELVILKNRNAASYDSQHFQLYPKYNYFVEEK